MRESISPIIVIGMHRSGTTMITSLLQRLGLYLGWVLQENSEALFFVERNEKLMKVCGGSWENPRLVENLIQHPVMRARAVEVLRQDMESVHFLSYLGPAHAKARGGLEKMDFAWGWKDPRNSYLLPLWLELFPNARIVHIYRHPMDVARSLQVRENRMIERQAARLSGREVPEDPRRKTPDIRQEKGLLYFYRRFRAVQGRVAALRRYDYLRVPSTLSMEAGLKLWEAYVGKCFEHIENRPNPSLTMKYEDFLVNPVGHLERLRKFCGLPGDLQQVKGLCENIRIERRFAFLKDPEAARIFEGFRENALVKRLGYDAVE